MKMTRTSAIETGGLVARCLTGSWRAEPPASDFAAADFQKIAPLLRQTGAGALGWWRVRNSKSRSCAASEDLLQAYRLNILNSRINRSKIETVFTLMHSVGIEPILLKGWAAARYYSDQGLRPYGDIDISVRRDDYQNATRALAGLDPLKFKVDLHARFSKFGIKQEEELFARSQLVVSGRIEVRILCAEDHLRVICFHLMREGAWRPL
jgi:Uncharacterised nucleotidyltransferase